MEQEEWRKIDPPFSKYSVSNLGRVRNDETDYIYSINQSFHYPMIGLKNSETSKISSKSIHILVAQQFLDYNIEKQKDIKIVVHHIDANTKNSKLSNLKIISRRQNNLYSRKKENRKCNIILQCNLNGNIIKEYKSINMIPFKSQGIYRCINGKTHTAYGYIWRYKENQIIGEIWKKIIFNNIEIEVSNKGRIKTRNGPTYGSANNRGYMRATFSDSMGKAKNISIHRAVCQAFKSIDNCSNKQVNHIDSNKQNNCIENLEWVSQSENSKHYHNNNKIYSIANERKKKSVVRISYDGKIKFYASITDAAKNNGKINNISSISKCCHGELKTSYSYFWCFTSNYDEKNYPPYQIIKRDVLQTKNIKKYICISPDGTRYITDKGLKKFCQEHDLSDTTMSAIARGKKRIYKGWKCEYYYDNDSQRQGIYLCISPEGKKYFAENGLGDFCKKFELNANAMRGVARGHYTHKGWKCEYYTERPIDQ